MLITAENVLHNTTQTLVTAEKLIHDTTQKHAQEMDAFKTAVARDNLLWCEEFVELNQTHRDTDGNDDEWRMMMRKKRMIIKYLRYLRYYLRIIHIHLNIIVIILNQYSII
jgi:hypothetical protein